MTIDDSGKWWRGDSPADIEEYLRAYTSDGYPIVHYRACACPCGSVDFTLEKDSADWQGEHVLGARHATISLIARSTGSGGGRGNGGALSVAAPSATSVLGSPATMMIRLGSSGSTLESGASPAAFSGPLLIGG